MMIWDWRGVPAIVMVTATYPTTCRETDSAAT